MLLMSQYAEAKKKPVKKPKKQVKKSKKTTTKTKNVLNSKLVQKILKRQAKRLVRITEFKKKGAIGESDSGFLAIRGTSALKKSDKEKMQVLVRVENSDREKLYSKIIKANSYSKEDASFLKFTMFESYLLLDKKGTYYYRADAWQKK